MKVRKAEIRPILMATFPNYKGRMFQVQSCRRMALWDLNWSGGTRNQYKAVDFTGRVATVVPRAPWMETREAILFELPPDSVVVKHTYFCGKDLGITVFCHPDLLPKWLPERTGK